MTCACLSWYFLDACLQSGFFCLSWISFGHFLPAMKHILATLVFIVRVRLYFVVEGEKEIFSVSGRFKCSRKGKCVYINRKCVIEQALPLAHLTYIRPSVRVVVLVFPRMVWTAETRPWELPGGQQRTAAFEPRKTSSSMKPRSYLVCQWHCTSLMKPFCMLKHEKDSHWWHPAA